MKKATNKTTNKPTKKAVKSAKTQDKSEPTQQASEVTKSEVVSLEETTAVLKDIRDEARNVLQVKKLDPKAKLPVRAHSTDAGLDLFALESFELAKFERKSIKTGIAAAIPEGYVGFIKEKSGYAQKLGFHVLAGVVDCGYSGDISVVLYNPRGHTKDESGQKVFNDTIKFEAGQKIAQMVVLPVSLCEVEEVDELGDTDRGSGSFGSTGDK